MRLATYRTRCEYACRISIRNVKIAFFPRIENISIRIAVKPLSFRENTTKLHRISHASFKKLYVFCDAPLLKHKMCKIIILFI